MNSETAPSFAPWPWEVSCVHYKPNPNEWPSFRIKAGDGQTVCACGSNATRPGHEIKANGLLIAAAPDLYAALEAAHNQVVLMFCEEFAATLSPERCDSIKTTLAVTRAALDKARNG